MIGMTHVDVDLPNGASRVLVDGQVRFDQDEPILIDSIKRTLYDSDPIAGFRYAKHSLP